VLAGLLAAASLGTATASAAVTQVGTCKLEPYAQCSGANLSGADLSHVNFYGADLHNANLQGANLSYVRLQHANLQGANLSGTNMHQVLAWRANVKSASLTGANLAGAVFTDANFDGSQLDYAHLQHLEATHASMQSANFAGSKLDGARLDHADLRHANFHSATLHHTQFTGADIRDAAFFNANFYYTNLQQANAVGAKFWPSNLEADPGALHAVFEKVAAHLDAYEDFGHCVRGSTFTSTDTVYANGECVASGQPGGSHGFNATSKTAGFRWSASSKLNSMTVTGADGVSLAGYCSHDWASFAVTSVRGLSAYPTQGIERRPGSPGGPLVLAIHYRRWHNGDKFQDGYTMFMNGWLLRQHHPTITPGPRPR